MKIIQFTPNLLNRAPEGLRRRAGEADFAAELASAGKPADGLVSLENRRALSLPPPDELGQAGRLLSRLTRAISAAPPEALAQAHNLEGLICLYRKTAD